MIESHPIAHHVSAVADTMVRVRRQIHAYPELSNDEFATTKLLRGELLAARISDIRPIGNTGLVADVSGRADGGMIALRADIDALPIQETADVPFRSRRDGVMHACGHDVHTAMVLGAIIAARSAQNLPCSIRAIFQPAEENEPLGGRAVVAGGHLTGVQGVIALHVDPNSPTGVITLRDGEMMAASDVFEATIQGRQCHAGWPQAGIDAIVAAAAFIQQSQVIVSRRIDPRAATVINFGSIAGGVANNVVCDRVVIKGAIRTLDETARPTLRQMLRDVLMGACRTVGATGELTVLEGEPILRNDPGLADSIRRAGRRVPGAEVRELIQPTMNGEDFAFYGVHVPIAMAWIGCRNQALGYTYPLHHPKFAADEAIMVTGASVLLEAALQTLGSPPDPSSEE